MDRGWYHGQDYYPHTALHAHSRLSPTDDLLTSVAFNYPPRPEPDSEALTDQGPLYPPLDRSMNGHAFPQYHDHGAPRVDGLAPISPLQPQYNGTAFPTPYPDSNASSAPSEDPLIADVEEDKRKRNQAASARFRQKKKQREQQMMEQTRDMQEKNKRLEGEVEGLKRENTFLKKLLVEKIDNMSPEDRDLLVRTTTETSKESD
ncbi:uncharacterized protein N0V89_005632 [Didymosphaeria variabile]|uniref:BZIP domain-containing protein n=1 Tax=Didymosphaeria variabile TaxID=1932322 RepID=A0A9W9CAN2_9PLEO|nr:uncharacterized protein N0V89_005632 [Didymosphaeria variabile]KAJ4353901.1 hypothetical protein N0V89_005632 [Didymosphaeria variabile]